MITYNHENFIKDAIEGVLMQEFSGEIELIIANDCSPDGADNVVKILIENHPRGEWIKYTNHSANKGMMNNFIWALKQAKGKYIALCEGDDYWIDPLKLQKQYEILETYNEFIITTHDAIILKSVSSNSSNYVNEKMKSESRFHDLLESCSFPTASFFFRNNVLSADEVNILNKGIVGDWILVLLLLKHGNLHYSNKPQSVYNLHDNNVWANKSKINQIEGRLTIYQFIIENLDLTLNENQEASLFINNHMRLLIKVKIINLNFSFLQDLFRFYKKNGLKYFVVMIIKFVLPSRVTTMFKKI